MSELVLALACAKAGELVVATNSFGERHVRTCSNARPLVVPDEDGFTYFTLLRKQEVKEVKFVSSGSGSIISARRSRRGWWTLVLHVPADVSEGGPYEGPYFRRVLEVAGDPRMTIYP